jgi:uncharacterized membrane protein YozB (DUF420 family)
MNIVAAVAFIVILGALLMAGVAMVRRGRPDQHKSKAMARALTVRIGVSVALFLGILLAYQLGWIHPTGLPLK